MSKNSNQIYKCIVNNGKERFLTDDVLMNVMLEVIRDDIHNEQETNLTKAISNVRKVHEVLSLPYTIIYDYALQLTKRQDYIEVMNIAKLFSSIQEFKLQVELPDDFIEKHKTDIVTLYSKEGFGCRVELVWNIPEMLVYFEANKKPNWSLFTYLENIRNHNSFRGLFVKLHITSELFSHKVTQIHWRSDNKRLYSIKDENGAEYDNTLSSIYALLGDRILVDNRKETP